jgi:RNA-directed DNA polymerase
VKRVGNLWPKVTSFENLLESAEAAAAGKRSRPDVARFQMELEIEVLRLRRELLEGAYEPGPYRGFPVNDGKPRLISAAPFRDRVIHHALTRVLEPIFECRFSPNSYACRKGLGTHRALEAAKAGMRRFEYVLKCDVRKYFESIDHTILNNLLARVVKCRPTLDLAAHIIEGWRPAEEPALVYFENDDLFTPLDRRRGLPLGNQTSQFFANVYLDPLDRWVLQAGRADMYVRYVDDFLVFEDRKTRLAEIRDGIGELLGQLRLRLHEGKSVCTEPARESRSWAGDCFRSGPGWIGVTWCVSGDECGGSRGTL